MFCFQCQETAGNKGCTKVGVCGKDENTANSQDLLIYVTKGLAEVLNQIQNVDSKYYDLISNNMFVTITNANFDEEDILDKVEETIRVKDELIKENKLEDLSDAAKYTTDDREELKRKAIEVGVLNIVNEDERSLVELITYGLKGMAAYNHHANVLGFRNDQVDKFIAKTLEKTLKDDKDINDLINLTMETGKHGLMAMETLDKANTEKFGNPEITEVDFSAFQKLNGPILMTTNCIVPLKKDNDYLDRLFTTGNAGYPGAKHIDPDENGHKDFSQIIEMAKACKAPENLENTKIVGGFAHNQVEALAGDVVKEIKAGNIKKFVVMAGCDGRHKGRSYYTEFAEKLPKDYVILTAGCAKYRYNKLNLGDINGIPRVLDAGQCNDSYSLVKTALLLQDAFELESVNDLPLEFNIAWYEQKAVIVLLALLSLGVKNIHLGPTLPAFLSETVVNFLVENFNISPITSV